MFNPFMAKFSNALYNASEKTILSILQITHTIYLLETIMQV